jgi:hypothetical protein
MLTAQTSGSGAHTVNVNPQPRGRSVWVKIGAAVAGIATIIGTLIALATWLGWGPF